MGNLFTFKQLKVRATLQFTLTGFPNLNSPTGALAFEPGPFVRASLYAVAPETTAWPVRNEVEDDDNEGEGQEE